MVGRAGAGVGDGSTTPETDLIVPDASTDEVIEVFLA